MSTLFTYVRIVLFGRAMASADSNHSLLSTLKREPKTAECAEIAGLITWQAAFCFSRVFLVSTSIGCQLHHNDEKRPFRLIVKVILKDLLIMTQLISRSWNFYPRIKMSKEVISLARKLRRVSEDHPPLFLVTHSVNCHNT